MRSWIRIVLTVLVTVAAAMILLAIWSEIDPALLAQITGSVWVVGVATILIACLIEESNPLTDKF